METAQATVKLRDEEVLERMRERGETRQVTELSIPELQAADDLARLHHAAALAERATGFRARLEAKKAVRVAYEAAKAAFEAAERALNRARAAQDACARSRGELQSLKATHADLLAEVELRTD